MLFIVKLSPIFEIESLNPFFFFLQAAGGSNTEEDLSRQEQMGLGREKNRNNLFHSFFCSELIAAAYKAMGLFSLLAILFVFHSLTIYVNRVYWLYKAQQ